MDENKDAVEVTELSAKERVQLELKELLTKMQKLQLFLFGEQIIDANLTQDMIGLMDSQLRSMMSYAAVLQNRLAHWDDKEKIRFYHEYYR